VTLRVARAARPLTDDWRHLVVEPRGSTALGISFRPLQAEAMGLPPRDTLAALLGYEYQLIRLGALWNRMEPQAGVFDPASLDWQVEAAERAGKQIVLAVGAVKNFGYPEFFVPPHRLQPKLRERSLVTATSHPELLAGAMSFVARVVERYRDRKSVVGWQVEHEPVDPLGIEHSWRLATEFVRQEVDVVRQTDSTRPILINGFVPMSLPVALQQWFRTRDQGDSLSLAESVADIVGVDMYPRHALTGRAGFGVYLDASESRWNGRLRSLLMKAAAKARVMITEGQAEPWESVTNPPNPASLAMYSCPPDRVVENYNRCMRLARDSACALEAYLFWGAEYWLLRQKNADPSYLGAFQRILDVDA